MTTLHFVLEINFADEKSLYLAYLNDDNFIKSSKEFI